MAGTITIGGVTYDKSAVTSYREGNDKKGNKEYIVALGDILLSYPKQKNAKVNSYGNNSLCIYDINGAVIYGADQKEDSIYILGNSNNNTIDVKDISDMGTKTGKTPADCVQLPKDSKNNVVYKNSQDRVIYF